MANPDGELTVAQRLGRALDRGLLPAGGPAEAAERLIERLERPARVALLGLPGSGKSSILNLLVGALVVPETLRLPTIIVQHGDVARMICTLTDGTTKIVPGHDLAEVLPLAPALVTLEMDLPALRVISLLEVSAGPMEAEQKRAATWASKRADIVIWCTTSYLPKEQAVWESLPDAVKDNSFMFLTKVDLLGSRDAALAMHNRVELRASEEFRQILSISAKQARAAMPAAGPVNRDLFRDSGASAVIAAIKTRVQSGRRADMDTAELLLARHVEASELVARRFAEGDGEGPAKAWTPPPEPDEPATAPAEVAAETPVRPAEPAAPSYPVEPPEEPAEVVATAAPPAEDPLPDVAPPEAEPAHSEVRVAPPEPEPDPAPAAEPVPAPDEGSTTRRRFADRIKRVAADGETAAAPLVPLKSTWKSKTDTEAAPEPEPSPAPRPSEATRRPRAAATPVAEPEAPKALESTPVPEPEVTATAEAPAPPEPEVEPASESVAEEAAEAAPEAPEPRERRPRAVTPRPEPAIEAARASRPQLFGARRGPDRAGSPLPDLSSLRATPEEMAASAEAREDSSADQVVEPPPPETDDDWVAPSLEVEASEPPESGPEPAPVPAAQTDRPRLFDRVARARPVEAERTPRPEPVARTTPIARMPAPQRTPIPKAAEEPVTARPALDQSQFSPRAIMMRERRVEPEAPAPRRERPRIAARAVPVPAATTAQPVVSDAEHGLVDEAIGLIVTRSAELEQEVDPEGKVLVDLILDHARETVDQVLAVVSRGQSGALRKLSGEMGEVVDLILLMQLEKGHAPADDALTLLLQLKRELETLRAA